MPNAACNRERRGVTHPEPVGGSHKLPEWLGNILRLVIPRLTLRSTFLVIFSMVSNGKTFASMTLSKKCMAVLWAI